MKSILRYTLISLIVGIALSQPLNAQPTATKPTVAGITITTPDKKVVKLTPAQIAAMPHDTLTVQGHDEQMHTYSGVPLAALLTKAGVLMGKEGKKNVASTYVMITAADKYQALYALSEMDSVFSDKKVMLADGQDGEGLPKAMGQYQIISSGEKKHARMIHNVVSIAVVKP